MTYPESCFDHAVTHNLPDLTSLQLTSVQLQFAVIGRSQ